MFRRDSMLHLIDESMKHPRTYTPQELATQDTAQQTAEKVCRILLNEDKPFVDRVVESGYLHHPDAVTPELLEATLRTHPELVLRWSTDDKRCTGTWYILAPGVRKGETRWEVGFTPGGPQYYYEDAAVACAHYIKFEMEQSAALVRTKVRPE